MSRRLLTDALGLDPDGELSITDLQFVQWGRDLIFGCEYRETPTSVPVTFRLVFQDCRELRWKTYAHAVYDESLVPTAPLVDFAPGLGNHRRDASFLTAHFAATLSYGDLSIEARDRRLRL